MRIKWEKLELSKKSENEVRQFGIESGKVRIKWEKLEFSKKSENEVRKIRIESGKWEWSEKN